MSLTNNSVAVVTGAAAGIGRALAIRLATEKIKGVAIADVNQTGLNETANLLENSGVQITTHIVNVGDLGQMRAFADDVIAKHQAVTHVVNNAGVSLFGDIEQVSIEDLDWLMQINYWGVVYGTKLFLPILRRQKSAHIVNVSSVFGLVAPPGNAAYAASKFAVRGFTEALRHEMRNFNVAVSCVFPGGIATDIAVAGRVGAGVDPIQKEESVNVHVATAKTTPEQAAEIIVEGIKRRDPHIYIGADAHQISLISRLFPRRWLSVMNLLSGGNLFAYRQTREKAV